MISNTSESLGTLQENAFTLFNLSSREQKFESIRRFKERGGFTIDEMQRIFRRFKNKDPNTPEVDGSRREYGPLAMWLLNQLQNPDMLSLMNMNQLKRLVDVLGINCDSFKLKHEYVHYISANCVSSNKIVDFKRKEGIENRASKDAVGANMLQKSRKEQSRDLQLYLNYEIQRRLEESVMQRFSNTGLEMTNQRVIDEVRRQVFAEVIHILEMQTSDLIQTIKRKSV